MVNGGGSSDLLVDDCGVIIEGNEYLVYDDVVDVDVRLFEDNYKGDIEDVDRYIKI